MLCAGGDSPHEVTTIEEKVDEERENMGGGSEEKKKEVEVVEEKVCDNGIGLKGETVFADNSFLSGKVVLNN